MNYYISVNGTQRGPFPADQLVAQGLRPDSLVWTEGMAQWERADRVPALMSVVARLGAGPGNPAVGPGPQPAQRAQPVNAPYTAQPAQPVQPGYPPYTGQPMQPVSPALADANSKKIAAGLCGIFLGTFGVHKFIMGYTMSGVIMLLVSCTCVGAPIMHIIGLIEGIMYLTKNDAEFYQTYMVNQREWF